MEAGLAREYLEGYKELRQVFSEETGHDLYLIGGSLLGPVRNGRLVKNDKDMDVAYLSKHTDVSKVRDELVEIVLHLAARYPNVELVREEWTAVRTHFRWRINSRMRIDIMPAWFGTYDDALRYCRPTFVGVSADHSMILPLREVELHGVDVLFPAEAQRKLALVYGETWQKPDPTFNKKATRSGVAKREIKALRFSWRCQFRMIRETRQAAQFSWFDFLWIWLATHLWVKGLWRIVRLRPTFTDFEYLL